MLCHQSASSHQQTSSPIPLKILVYTYIYHLFTTSNDHSSFLRALLLHRQSALNKRPINDQLILSLRLKLHLGIRTYNEHIP